MTPIIVRATQTPLIFWFNGSAGTGLTVLLVGEKSTLTVLNTEQVRPRSLTLPQKPPKLAKFLRQASSARASTERSNPNLIFPSNYFFLRSRSRFPVPSNLILNLIPDIGYSSVSYQLEELIIKPIRTIENPFLYLLSYWMPLTNAGTTVPRPSSCLHFPAILLISHRSRFL